jgi:hypothetical protein
MKVLAFNASPRKDKGTTDILLNYFLEAATKVGASAKKHYVTDLEINGCTGCFTCWTKTPGKCIHSDDMDWILPEFIEANIIVLATPVYNGNITHYLQKMTERLLPTALPWQVENGETTKHPPRHQREPPKIVLIATAGFPDHQAFNIPKALYPQSLTITLPAAQIIANPEDAKHIQDFMISVQQAATVLVQGGIPGQDLIEKLNVLYSPEMKHKIRNQANRYFETHIEE